MTRADPDLAGPKAGGQPAHPCADWPADRSVLAAVAIPRFLIVSAKSPAPCPAPDAGLSGAWRVLAVAPPDGDGFLAPCRHPAGDFSRLDTDRRPIPGGAAGS